MKVKIKIIDSWDEYQKAWKICAKSLPWVKEEKFLHYNIEEELEELKNDFQDKINLFLGAINEENNEIIGCLSIRVRSTRAIIRRWEPVIQEKYSFGTIGKLLLDEGIRILRDKFVQTIQLSLKYELNDPVGVQNLLDLYLIFGFIDYNPPAIQFVKNLTKKRYYFY